MERTLAFEMNRFVKNRRQLKRILANTHNALQDIAKSEYFTKEQLSTITLQADEELKIQDIIDNPVGLIIFGSKSWAKAVVVNELLGYALLPVTPADAEDSEINNNWRTVKFLYGPQTQVSLAVANCYELVEHFAVYDRVCHQIPRSDLELRESNENNDPGYYTATLEIKLPHQLLAEDVQIIVTPSSCPQISFENTFHTCFDGISPIIIYALTDTESLSLREVDDLMELKKVCPKAPIFFIRAQRSVSVHLTDPSSTSELTESQQHLFLKQFSKRSASVAAMCEKNSPFYNSPTDTNDDDNTIWLNKVPMSQQSSSPPSSPVSIAPTSSISSIGLHQQLISLGFFPSIKTKIKTEKSANSNLFSERKSKQSRLLNLSIPTMKSELIENFENFSSIKSFVRQSLQILLVTASSLLFGLHNRCLRMFILTAFDMTRDMLITPKRIEYAKHKEQQLYESLLAIADRKQDELKQLILDTLDSMRNEIIEGAVNYKFKFKVSLNPHININEELFKQRQQQQKQRMTFTKNDSNDTSDDSDVAAMSVPCPSTSTTASSSSSSETSQFNSFSKSSNESSTVSENVKKVNTVRDIQLAMTEIQDYVLGSLNSAIADKLIGSVDYLRESYIGTLERCLESLEKTEINEGIEALQASNALKHILTAAYQVEINMKTTSSLVRAFWEKVKQLLSSSMPWKHQPIIDKEWKRKIALDVLNSLSEWRLAKSICYQFKERLRISHENFISAMKHLESLHNGRLERTEEQRVRVRRYFAPRIARFALESISLRDVIMHGMPQLGREIGRGQYGVVYSCESWGGHSPVALKSVVPPDDKHWNDLAMEFYYTRSIPEHERIVQIRGSVIDYSYGGGSTPAVLLIMDRLTRDLYSAIKNGLSWLNSLQVAIDVVQGIRFLHSQGLVHRDIKLKNVLLDKRNRGKITDLGFCKPEAMMSGSIVGTPIHMAPELFSGKYDNTVDVYAFGILFWYICAGHVRLPYVFEQCQNKDQLWSCVRKGARPERLPRFDDECWEIMESCWAGDPAQRPLLGEIEPKLNNILERYKSTQSKESVTHFFPHMRYPKKRMDGYLSPERRPLRIRPSLMRKEET